MPIGKGEIVTANCPVEGVSAGDRVRNAGLAVPGRTEPVRCDGLSCSRRILRFLRPGIGFSRLYKGRVGKLRRTKSLQWTRHPPEHVEESHRGPLIAIVIYQV